MDVVGGGAKRGIKTVDGTHVTIDAERVCEVGKFAFNDSGKVINVLSSKFGKGWVVNVLCERGSLASECGRRWTVLFWSW